MCIKKTQILLQQISYTKIQKTSQQSMLLK